MPAAPSAPAGPGRAPVRGFVRRLHDWRERGRFDPALLLGDAAAAGWLAFAFFAFTGRPRPAPGPLALGVAAVVVLARAANLHGRPARLARGLAARGVTLAVLVGAALFLLRARHGVDLSSAAIVWLATATVIVLLTLRLALWTARERHPDQPLEIVRWVLLGAAATALLLPFYGAGAVGTGDAQWYLVMFADFITQLRAGVFPVWVGQSVYAFNGAINPLRFAPWYQYAGGFVDLLTALGLGFGALSNATLALTGLAAGASAYAGLRDVLPRRPGLACLLALLFLASPGVLAPLMAGDQYMTFMATPFLPVILSGLYRQWTRDDRSGPRRLAVGLAGVWLSHAPIALWCTLLAGGTVAVQMARRRHWLADARRLLPAGLIFAALGSLPFLSVLALDNLSAATATGSAVVPQVSASFPANFAPIDARGDKLPMYQLGYGALGALLLAIVLLPKRPPRGTWLFIGAALAVVPVLLPVPWLNRLLWDQAPGWFVTIDNVWPMQRLCGLWAGLMLFAFAVVAADERIAGHRRLAGACLVVVGALAAWSGREARKLQSIALASARPPAALAAALDPRNVVLTRYAYGSFAWAPDYLSHGYLDPLLENRILAHDTLALMTANADRAAPPLQLDAGSGDVPRLRQTGVFTAERTPAGDAYRLTPELSLVVGSHQALRLEFSAAVPPGVLQLENRELSREYLLPDSGAGLDHHGPPGSFGSLATSSGVLPLAPVGPEGATARLRFIPDAPGGRTHYVFGRFQLYDYRPGELAIVVESWIPYRAAVDVAVPAFLETPRMWLGGYRARDDGRPAMVRRSPNNLAMVELHPGANEVTLTYHPPWWLGLSFWATAIGWAVVAVTGLRRLIPAAGGPTAPA